ncbi:MAG TPA: hypothetical protein VGM10_08275 [Actinocrinis sp.]|jgi:hypothetical protein
MKRIPLASTLALTSAIAMVGLIAPSASAATAPSAAPADNGYVFYAAYGWGDACSSAGYAGEQAGKWVSYYCDEIGASSVDGPGLYDLYVDY